MAERFEITDDMRAQIGAESPPWTYEVTSTSVRAFARGVGYVDPVYYDIAAARRAGYRNLPAPPTYLGTPVFLPGRSHDTFSVPIEGQPTVKHGLRGLLDGGSQIEYFADICAGDTLTVVNRLENLEVRQSKALGTMLIATQKTSVTNQDGTLVAVYTGQAIYY